MRLLIDTHLLLWMLYAPAKLSAPARRQIEKSDVFVSAASIWEISIKTSLGKLAANSAEVLAAVEPTGFSLLPISGEHAARVADLPLHHRDPFDRLLVAQAQLEPMGLLSNDGVLRAYGDFVILV
jgi:PIN domain nuclease of toxin-antitoxin system